MTLTDYPAPDWALTAIIRGKQEIDLAATGDGATHTFSVDGAITADWIAGHHVFSIRATNGGDVREIQAGQLQILPDLAAITGEHDGRTQNEIALDAISAVLARRATLDQDRYTINNRELWRTPIADLLKLQAVYRAAVAREKCAKAGNRTFGRRINVKFS